MNVMVVMLILASDPEPSELRHIFNPTPADQMREFECDRPDRTESPYSVPAGHAQFEVDLATFSVRPQSRENAASASIGYLAMNAKLGLLSNWDLQVLFSPITQSIRGSDQSSDRLSVGLDSVTVRSKINVWGNDNGSTALGLLPYLTLATNGRPELLDAGLIVPFGSDFFWGTSLGAQIAVGVVKSNSVYQIDVNASASIGRTVYGPLSAYVELFA